MMMITPNNVEQIPVAVEIHTPHWLPSAAIRELVCSLVTLGFTYIHRPLVGCSRKIPVIYARSTLNLLPTNMTSVMAANATESSPILDNIPAM